MLGKGEYLVYEPCPGEERDFVRSLVVPVPSKVTAGVYVFSSLYGNVVVGPTMQFQRSKTDRSCDPAVQAELSRHAESLFPALESRGVLKVNDFRFLTLLSVLLILSSFWCFQSFSGLRPACQDVERHNDYQVRFDPEGHWVTLGGIR